MNGDVKVSTYYYHHSEHVEVVVWTRKKMAKINNKLNRLNSLDYSFEVNALEVEAELAMV